MTRAYYVLKFLKNMCLTGTGKTTVLREICRMLAINHNLCIVDTSNEIAGDGIVPHSSVGPARRMVFDTHKHIHTQFF